MSVDLSTRYLGLQLRSPIVASASPYTRDPQMTVRLEQAGAGPIVMSSLSEEEIEAEELQIMRTLEAGTEQFAEALDYFPESTSFSGAGDRYLRDLALRQAVDPDQLVRLSELSEPRGVVVNGRAPLVIAALTFLVVFLISLAVLVGMIRLRDRRVLHHLELIHVVVFARRLHQAL